MASAICVMFPLASTPTMWDFGEARQGCGLEVGRGATGRIVEDDGLVADGLPSL
jgi:hypothetical protein